MFYESKIQSVPKKLLLASSSHCKASARTAWMAFGLKHTAPHTQKSEAGLLRILLGIFHDSVQRQTGGEGRGLVKVPTCTPGRVLTCTAQLQGPAPLGMAVTKGRARPSDPVGMAAGAGLGLCPLPAAFLLHVGSSPLTHVC